MKKMPIVMAFLFLSVNSFYHSPTANYFPGQVIIKFRNEMIVPQKVMRLLNKGVISKKILNAEIKIKVGSL